MHSHSLIELGDQCGDSVQAGEEEKTSKDERNGQSDTRADHAKIATPSNEVFGWLRKWLIYFPMGSRPHHGGKDNNAIKSAYSIVYLCLAVVISIGEILWYMIPLLMEEGLTLYTAVYTVAITAVTVAKLAGLYYFWFLFDFERLCKVSLGDETVYYPGDKAVNQSNIRMKALLSLLVICVVTLITVKFVQRVMNPDAELSDWLSLLRSVTYYWMFDIPLFLTQFILSVSYCKGHIFICNLDQMITKTNTAEVDFERMLKEYKLFRSNFKRNIRVLEFLLKCRLGAMIAWIWIDVTELMEADTALYAAEKVVYLAASSLPFLELVASGSPATTTFHTFKDHLYELKELSLKLMYLLSFVTEYPFLVKIFSKEISFKNAFRLVAAFVVAKTLAYLVRVRLE